MAQSGPGGAPPEAVPTKQHLLVINSFVVDTTRFLNQFARVAEGKLREVGQRIGGIEKRLVLLEEKLARVPGIADEAAAPAPVPQSATEAAADAAGPVADATQQQAYGHSGGAGQATASGVDPQMSGVGSSMVAVPAS